MNNSYNVKIKLDVHSDDNGGRNIIRQEGSWHAFQLLLQKGKYKGRYFDVRVWLPDNKQILAGCSYVLDMGFLDWLSVKKDIAIGDIIPVREGILRKGNFFGTVEILDFIDKV